MDCNVFAKKFNPDLEGKDEGKAMYEATSDTLGRAHGQKRES